MTGPDTVGAVEAVLDAALHPHGFTRARRGTTWRRRSGAIEHQVGLRRSRSGEGGVAVHFAEAAAGAVPQVSFELSPVAPLSNTFWWPAQPSAVQARALREQIERIVLPFFAAPALDAAAVEHHVHAPLAPLRHCEPAFACSVEGVWWRERGRLIDLVLPQRLALDRFVQPWVAVWHHELPQGLSGGVPDGVTHAAAHTLGTDGLDGEPLCALFALHTAEAQADAWAEAAPGLLPAALAWFATLRSPADVLAQVRPELQAAMTRSP